MNKISQVPTLLFEISKKKAYTYDKSHDKS